MFFWIISFVRNVDTEALNLGNTYMIKSILCFQTIFFFSFLGSESVDCYILSGENTTTFQFPVPVLPEQEIQVRYNECI
jgi:hypothetical protein